MARLDQLCSAEGGDDDNGYESWAKLFKYVVPPHHQSMTALTLPSTLRLTRDNGNTLYNRINAEGYQESEDDIQAVSGIAEDIRDALLDYQVCDNITAHTTFWKLKSGHFDSSPSSVQYTIKIAS